MFHMKLKRFIGAMNFFGGELTRFFVIPFILWANLSVSLGILFAGGLVYPAISLAGTLTAELNCPELIREWQGKALYPKEWGERLKGIEFELPVKAINFVARDAAQLSASSFVQPGSYQDTPSQAGYLPEHQHPTKELSGVSAGYVQAPPPEQSAGYPVVALTLDACSGLRGGNCDTSILDFLENNSIPATIFVTPSWIKRNPECFSRIIRNPLFELGSHGLRHLPASMTGKEVYGIKGTGSPAELCDEVVGSSRIIEKLTGGAVQLSAGFSSGSSDLGNPLSHPNDSGQGSASTVFAEPSGFKTPKIHWFRAGTAFYDELAVSFIRRAGFRIAGYSITLDQGATLGKNEVAKRVLRSKGGDILLAHMHRPKSGTGPGLLEALPKLLEKGFVFVRLSDLPRK